MSKIAKIQTPTPPPFDGGAVLNALADAILVAEADGAILYANVAAEEFFATSLAQMRQFGLDYLLPADSPIFSLVRNVAADGNRVSEYEVELETPRIGPRLVTLQVAPAVDAPGRVVVSIHDQSLARKIDFQISHRNAARSMTAMSAILAHEVKNPLSGIRGAAQLLEQGVSSRERDLTRLICDEVDRICALVDRFDMFSDQPTLRQSAVNIHEVLDHVQRVAENGFGRHIHFVSIYDPSLPPVRGNRDQLVQVFLNLVKNRAVYMRAPKRKGEIVLSTTYRHGIRLAVGGGPTR
ncbi:MAG: histidine kinase dimerization/phospho-acceptor domain-containing protein [Alphaproteobacteria bacterium]